MGKEDTNVIFKRKLCCIVCGNVFVLVGGNVRVAIVDLHYDCGECGTRGIASLLVADTRGDANGK